MPFAKLKHFNHTDPTLVVTSQADILNLNNEFWDRLKGDRIVSRCPTKRKDLRPTENTKYGRSETREVDVTTGKGAAIKIGQYGGNIIAVRQAIQDLGPEGKAIGIQWHGSSTRPLVKGQYKNSKTKPGTFSINIQLAETFKGDDDGFILVDGIEPGEIFDLAIGFDQYTFIAAYNWSQADGVVKTIKINQDNSYNQDKGLYSKWGIYCQTDIDCPFEQMREGTGSIIHLEIDLYHGDKLDLSVIDLDSDSFWRVGETIYEETPERKELPGKTPTPPTEPTKPVEPSTPEQPQEPVKEPEPNPAPTPFPEPTKQPLPNPAGAEELFKLIPEKYKANCQRLVGQIQVNVTNGAKVTAKANLTKLEDILDSIDEEAGAALRNWCNVKRDAVK